MHGGKNFKANMQINNIQDIKQYLDKVEILTVSVQPIQEQDNYTFISFEFIQENVKYKADLVITAAAQIQSIDTLRYLNTIVFNFEENKNILFINRPYKQLLFIFQQSVQTIAMHMLIKFNYAQAIEYLKENKKLKRQTWQSDIFLTYDNQTNYLNINNTKLPYDFNENDEQATDWIIL